VGGQRPGESHGDKRQHGSPHSRENARSVFKSALGGASMQTWFRNFDKNLNGRIDFNEFKEGMMKMNYAEDHVKTLWNELDADGSGEITFDEIDYEQAQMWNAFRRFCGAHFQNPRDMICQLKASSRQQQGLPMSQTENLTQEEFTRGLQHFGWEKGFEPLLFSALDRENEEFVSARGLEWMSAEVRRFKLKEEFKQRAMHMASLRAQHKQHCQIVLQDFKLFLRRTFGNLFRGWRRALDLDGSMSVHRAELFKACRQLNWKGDVRALWQALDHDSSGTTTLEELDPGCAQLLAQFKEWGTSLFGDRPSAALFNALDRGRRRKLSYAQFVEECEARGFTRKVKSLAMWLDWQDKKHLVMEDFGVFDIWRPPEFLTATPSPSSAEEFKRHLKGKYGHLLKGWRTALDKDNSNCCNWHEFQEACRPLRASIDIAGAWLAFDEDLSGFITLREIDGPSHTVLMDFKRWAEAEFGGVKSAFRVLDMDNSGELTYREFRGACRNYGFQGDTKALFESLDIGGERLLHVKEVAFLDDWEDIPEAAAGGGAASRAGDGPELAAGREKDEFGAPQLLEWNTAVPGPGAYNVPCSFGAPAHVPGARHTGSYTIANPRKQPRASKSAGPANYSPSLRPTAQRKPAWSFGSSGRGTPRRSETPKTARGDIWGESRSGRTSPGPAAYDVRPGLEGPKFSMRPRRGMRLHPGMLASARGEVRGPSF